MILGRIDMQDPPRAHQRRAAVEQSDPQRVVLRREERQHLPARQRFTGKRIEALEAHAVESEEPGTGPEP